MMGSDRDDRCTAFLMSLHIDGLSRTASMVRRKDVDTMLLGGQGRRRAQSALLGGNVRAFMVLPRHGLTVTSL